ncbi:MAG: glycosyltransferase family 4 protein [Chloroflexota bacterium]
MRLLYFTRDYTPHDHRFLSALAQTEHKVYYLRLERSGYQLEDRPLPAEVELVSWAGSQTRARFADGPRLLANLKRVIRVLEPDLIQAGPLQRSAFLVALTGFHPLVSMSWGYDLLIDAERNPLWRWATRFTLTRSAALVGDSEVIRQKAVHYGIVPERVVTFPWGTDIHYFTPGKNRKMRSRLGWDEETFVLLSTRSWAPIYGVTDLAQAFVQAARSSPQLRLLMLGNGPLSKEIKSTFHQAGMLDRVHFPGHIKTTELPEYYRAADVYLSTSHSDGTSISLLEAMACGRPVLVTDIPGNREWVTHGEQGWLFPDGDIEKLKDAIIFALNHREQLPVMGKAARRLAEERADWAQNFPKLFEAYNVAIHHQS